jgi:hypothetical protein
MNTTYSDYRELFDAARPTCPREGCEALVISVAISWRDDRLRFWPKGRTYCANGHSEPIDEP